MNNIKENNKVKTTKPDYGFSGGFFTVMQNIGKSLVYPIAVLPMAALLLRFGVLFINLGTEDINGQTEIVNAFVYWLGVILVTPGAAVFDNLPLIFAVGVGFGFAKDHRGEAALAAMVGYLVLFGLVQTEGSLPTLFYGHALTKTVLDAETGEYVKYSKLLYVIPDVEQGVAITPIWMLNLGIFGGLEAGLIAAYAYNRWSNIQLPAALGFFSGRRFVPMAVISIMIGVSFVTAVIWPWLQLTLIYISIGIVFIPWLGAGVYAFLNRLLIPFGLHQVLNMFFWFQMPIQVNGEVLLYVTPDGNQVPILGDITAFMNAGVYATNGIVFDGVFYKNDEAWELLKQAHVGVFQTGFFPIMMAGVPAVALAMSLQADKDNRKSVLAFLGTAALVSFLTGITEPVEYSFMFISPLLYLCYAALSGVVASIAVLTGASFGFGFSAGLIDFLASIPVAIHLSRWGWWSIILMLIWMVISFFLYFFMAYYLIGRADLATPGRKGNITGVKTNDPNNNDLYGVDSIKQTPEKGGKKSTSLNKDKYELIAKQTINLVGGIQNIKNVSSCITRVRLKVIDNNIDPNEVKKIGYLGYAKVGKESAQFIIGPEAEQIANRITDLMS